MLAALQQVALSYLHRTVTTDVAFWRMVDQPTSSLRSRAQWIVDAAGTGSIVDSEALPGAGSAPGITMPSVAVAVDGDVLERLRAHEPPVIGRTRDARTYLDLRSVDPDDDEIVIAALSSLTT